MFRYSSRQFILHWAAVILLVLQYLANSPISQAFRTWMREGQKTLTAGAMAHIAVGIAILLVVLWRLALRRSAPAAPYDAGLLGLAARITHGLLYLLLIAIPLTGLAAWFGGVTAAGEAHEVMTNLLLALAGLHVAAALFHQFVLKDGLLNRMRPGSRA